MKLLNHVNRLSVTVFLATATVIGVSGCAGDRYHQSTGEHIDDASTTTRVKSALGDDSMYKYPDVKVSTFKGEVQLSGFVDHHDQKAKAAEIAKGVDGVKSVVNNITIKE